MKRFNVDQLGKRLDDALEVAERAIAAGIYGEALNITTDAVEKCPIDVGNLRRSHYVTLPRVFAGQVACELGAGGTAEDYAIVQHEGNFNHTDGDGYEQGERKWLQNAINKARPDAARNVAAIARSAFKWNNSMPKKRERPSHPDELPRLPRRGRA